ncbi:hypothetical protein B0H14DRAFT_2608233 [Mycena olivaceomarginata]|nr:hypothetical protein B0H14DRAFT_2608233 [Mycena olivaceomarginata]
MWSEWAWALEVGGQGFKERGLRSFEVRGGQAFKEGVSALEGGNQALEVGRGTDSRCSLNTFKVSGRVFEVGGQALEVGGMGSKCGGTRSGRVGVRSGRGGMREFEVRGTRSKWAGIQAFEVGRHGLETRDPLIAAMLGQTPKHQHAEKGSGIMIDSGSGIG